MKNENNSNKVAEHITDVMCGKEPRHEAEFKSWIETNRYAHDCAQRLSDKEELSDLLNHYKDERKREDARLLLAKFGRRQRIKRFIATGVAASAVISAVMLFLWTGTSEMENQIADQSTKIKSALILSPKLIMANGEEVNLDSSTNIQLGSQLAVNDSRILKIKAQEGSSEAARISRLVVPSQNTYSIILSDGTKVVLNANSELEFAETFSSANREVTLKGEGYFEVTKDPSKAFIVHANGVTVRVHGTKFNINGFEKENITTFLLEGSVSVSTDDSAPVRMKPMQVAKNNIVTKQQIVANVTNADKYLAWMSNNFIFNGTPVSEVVTMMENWYGIRFAELSKECRETLVSGSFSRSTKLGEMLIAIQNSINGKIYYENNQYHINLNQ